MREVTWRQAGRVSITFRSAAPAHQQVKRPRMGCRFSWRCKNRPQQDLLAAATSVVAQLQKGRLLQPRTISPQVESIPVW